LFVLVVLKTNKPTQSFQCGNKIKGYTKKVLPPIKSNFLKEVSFSI